MSVYVAFYMLGMTTGLTVATLAVALMRLR